MLKEKSIKNNYKFNNLLMDIQLKNVNGDIKNIKGGSKRIFYIWYVIGDISLTVFTIK